MSGSVFARQPFGNSQLCRTDIHSSGLEAPSTPTFTPLPAGPFHAGQRLATDMSRV